MKDGWGWKYSDLSYGNQKSSKQVVQRPRFKSHPYYKLGVGLLANQFTGVFTCKMEKKKKKSLPCLLWRLFSGSNEVMGAGFVRHYTNVLWD